MKKENNDLINGKEEILEINKKYLKDFEKNKIELKEITKERDHLLIGSFCC